MKCPPQFMMLAILLSSSSCVTTQDQSPHTNWINPNPEIERLHVQAYELDLGIGVEQDRIKANQLYLQAAQAGDPRSMMNYAINLANGQGVEADLVEAYSWTETARFLTQRMPDMKIKWRVRGLNDELMKELNPEQVKEGHRRAAIKVERIREILTSNHGLESTSAPPAAGTLETHP